MALATSAFVSFAFAQTPGLGETRPAPPQTINKEGPAAKTPPAPEKTQTDSVLGRCDRLEGAARDDCLREERDAAAGATRRAEPPTAPPPQNPR